MEAKVNLYEIVESYQKVDAMAEDNEALTEYLSSIQDQMDNKINATVRLVKNRELSSAVLEHEIKRLMDLKRGNDKAVENIKGFISRAMLDHGIEKIETDICKLSFRKSKAVVIGEVESLPKEFLNEKVTVTADKKAIKEAIEAGEVVPGAQIVENMNLQIK